MITRDESKPSVATCSKCGQPKDGRCKPCKAVADKLWRENNKEKTRAYFKKRWLEPERRAANSSYKIKGRFGSYDAAAIVASGCVRCGMTNEQSLEKWNERLCIDHIDNQGRRVKESNNDPANLQVLCRSCHATKTFTEDYQVMPGLSKRPLK